MPISTSSTRHSSLFILTAVAALALSACGQEPASLTGTTTPAGENAHNECADVNVNVDVNVDVHVDGTGVDVGDAGPSDPASSDGVDPGVQPIDSLFREVAFFQAVQVPVFADGFAVLPEGRNAPLIVGRQAIVRAMFDLPDGWTAAELTLEVDVIAGDTQTFASSRNVASASDDADPQSGLVVSIPADAIVADAGFVIRLLEEGDELARYPESADADLGAVATGALKVHFIPFDVDGFTPDTSATVIDGLRAALMATYPVTDVVVSVGPVEIWSGEADIGGINVRVGELQETAMFAGELSWDTYVYGMVTGVDSRDDYSGSTGTSEDGGNEELVRAYFATGAAFADQRSEDTLIHEIGHAHKLLHTECDGEANVDADYPYADGSIGVEGYDFRTDTFIAADTKSMMAYCYPRWVSDYSYAKIAQHVANAQGYAGYD